MLASLIIDDPQSSIGGCVDAVDETEQAHATRCRRRHALLARGRGDPLRLLDGEVAVNDPARVLKPRLKVLLIGEKIGNRRSLRHDGLVGGGDP